MIQHRINIDTPKRHPNSKIYFSAQCLCGWESQTKIDPSMARELGWKHLGEMLDRDLDRDQQLEKKTGD